MTNTDGFDDEHDPSDISYIRIVYKLAIIHRGQNEKLHLHIGRCPFCANGFDLCRLN